MNPVKTASQPLVSVIICCYNQQSCVAQAIESVLKQRCDFDFEVIVGDDASTDGTVEVCRQYRDRYPERVILLERTENLGLTANYFNCIEQTRGILIADCAGDDFWMGEDRLQHLADAFRTHPSAGIVYAEHADYHPADGSLLRHNPETVEECFDENDFGKRTVARFLSRRMHPEIVLSTSLYAKDKLLTYYTTHPEMFSNGRYPAEDISVTAALLMQGAPYHLHEVNLAYRIQEESVNHSRNPEKYYRFCLNVFVQTVEWAAFLAIEPAGLMPWLADKCRWCMDRAMRLGDAEGARQLREACRRYGFRMPWQSRVKYCVSQLLSNPAQ